MAPIVMGEIPASGPFSIALHLVAKGAQEADVILDALKQVQKSAKSDKEPGCVGFKVGNCTPDTTHTLVYIEFTDKAAYDLQIAQQPYKELESHFEDKTNAVYIVYCKDIA